MYVHSDTLLAELVMRTARISVRIRVVGSGQLLIATWGERGDTKYEMVSSCTALSCKWLRLQKQRADGSGARKRKRKRIKVVTVTQSSQFLSGAGLLPVGSGDMSIWYLSADATSFDFSRTCNVCEVKVWIVKD
jgi:hypothetical protein